MRTTYQYGSVFFLALAILLILSACKADPAKTIATTASTMDTSSTYQTVYLGAGCFWCVEAVFSELKGVISVKPGYSGGHLKNPTYKEVCSGTTGHAEVAEVVYDPAVLSFKDLLEVFFQTHDPTTLNRQGADVGTQYRSAIFYTTQTQKTIAEEIINDLQKSGAWDKPIVTEITAFDEFYLAEADHQEYYKNNPQAGYCRYVIQPKMDKFRKVFKDKLK